MEELINIFDEVKNCIYKERRYSVRDNGAIYRYPKDGYKPSPLDEKWTFGTKDSKTGYMLYGGVRVHQIVATAFHGNPENENMVVDHRDTNRCNNRPDNLSWVTRLENVLNNPITRKRVEFLCGSIEAFLNNPSILRESSSEPNTKWMRSVSKEDAAKCLKNLTRWSEEDKKAKELSPKRNNQGNQDYSSTNEFNESWDNDWMFKDPRSPWDIEKERIINQEIEREEAAPDLKPSLTELAKQINWKTPTAFPLCPKRISNTPLLDYIGNLKEGLEYCRNDYYASPVYRSEINENKDKIAVWTKLDGIVKNYALSEITFENGFFVHRSLGTYFSEEDAEKYFTLALGKEWTGGNSIDDYC